MSHISCAVDGSGVARAVAGPMVDGVAVDHRSDRIAAAQIVECEVHDSAALGLLDRVAEAMRQPCADQILDHVQLERRPADVRTEVRRLGRRAVLEVRMGQRAVVAAARRSRRGLRTVSSVTRISSEPPSRS